MRGVQRTLAESMEKVKCGMARAEDEGALTHEQARERLGKWLKH